MVHSQWRSIMGTRDDWAVVGIPPPTNLIFENLIAWPEEELSSLLFGVPVGASGNGESAPQKKKFASLYTTDCIVADCV